MSIITCSSNCAYQNDGYCTLDNVTEALNDEQNACENSCIHYKATKKDEKINKPKK